MKKIAIYIMRLGLNIIYFFIKLIPTKKNKIVFLSRQSNELTLDFRMIQEMLNEKYPEVEIASVFNRLEGEKSGGLVQFALSTLKSMYHMATSKVCVLDAYWPAVSILHHKKNLTVIQMWHAMGKIKQSGYQTLGKESGRSAEMAKLMKMHRGYDYIIAGGKAWNPFYCASFDTTEDKLVNYGLPRTDFLVNTANSNREKVLNAYPEFKNKKVVLYAPTFRRNIELHWEKLVEAVLGGEEDNTVLVVKSHPNQNLEITEEMRSRGVYTCDQFKSVDFLSTADYLVTDYSAIAVEGACVGTKTLYFVYDYEEYRSKNGMNIDLFEEMPGCVFRDAKDVAAVIKNDSYNQQSMDSYIARFLPDELGTSTEKIVNLIRENL